MKFNTGTLKGYQGQYPYSTATPSVGAQYSESPTIIYVPLSGEKFSTQLLTELSLDRLVFLSRAGWDMEFLFRLLVKRFGPAVNAAAAMDTGLNQDPARTGSFDRLVAMLRTMQARGDLELDGKDGQTLLQARFRDRGEAGEMERLLGLRLSLRQSRDGALVAAIRLSQSNDLMAENACDGQTCTVFVRMRNFIGLLDALSRGVESPGGDGMGPPVPFRITSNAMPPENAFVSASYDGRWYSIAKGDAGSRKVLSFLGQLFALEGGELPKNSPLLTLPVGR